MSFNFFSERQGMHPALRFRAMEPPYCGDQGGWIQEESVSHLFVIDAMGYGEDAEKTALLAKEYVTTHIHDGLESLFTGCDEQLRRTRGATMAYARIDSNQATLVFAGIGNCAGVIQRNDGSLTKLICDIGILGSGFSNLTSISLPVFPGDLIILHTDGIRERMHFTNYAKDASMECGRLADRIIADWGKSIDDLGVLVMRVSF